MWAVKSECSSKGDTGREVQERPSLPLCLAVSLWLKGWTWHPQGTRVAMGDNLLLFWAVKPLFCGCAVMHCNILCGHCKATLKVCVKLDANPKLSHFINPRKKYLKNWENFKSAAILVPGILNKGVLTVYTIVGCVCVCVYKRNEINVFWRSRRRGGMHLTMITRAVTLKILVQDCKRSNRWLDKQMLAPVKCESWQVRVSLVSEVCCEVLMERES